jgi:hypothetical protein
MTLTNAQRIMLALSAAVVAATIVLPPWRYVDIPSGDVAGYSWIWSPIGRSPCRTAPSSTDLDYVRGHPDAAKKFAERFRCTPDQAEERPSDVPSDIAWNILYLEWIAILLAGGLTVLSLHRRACNTDPGVRVASTKAPPPLPSDTGSAKEGTLTSAPVRTERPPLLTFFKWLTIASIVFNALELLDLALSVWLKASGNTIAAFPANAYLRALPHSYGVVPLADSACIYLAVWFLRALNARNRGLRKWGTLLLAGTVVVRVTALGTATWLEISAIPKWAWHADSIFSGAYGVFLQLGVPAVLSAIWCGLWLPYLLSSARVRELVASWPVEHVAR